MAQRRSIFLNIIILTGLLFSLFYLLSSNKFMQPRDEFIEVRENLEEHASDDYEIWLASAEKTDLETKVSPSNKIYPPEIGDNYSQQFKAVHKRTSFADLREYLCHGEPKLRRRSFEKSAVKHPCPKNHIVTYIAGGRSANQMWNYAGIWVFAQITGLTPYTPGCAKYGLGEIFEQLSIPNMDNIVHCPIEFKNTIANSIEDWNGNQSIIIPRFTFQYGLIIPYLYRIVKEEFVFKRQLRIKAQAILTEALNNASNPEFITFIGVHVRRTDYLKYMNTKYNTTPAPKKYYFKAMEYYRNKYKRCLFIITSDDPEWCYNQFGKLQNVFVASYNRSNTAGEDMAIMAACNHSIFDYGTYGEWGAILAGGETIYKSINNQGRTSRRITGWRMMD